MNYVLFRGNYACLNTLVALLAYRYDILKLTMLRYELSIAKAHIYHIVV